MAKQKAGVYDKVLECAKEEFLSKGFLDASLRTIAQAADTSTGSIYTRFGDKEGLFRAIAEPVVDQFKAMFRRVQEDFHQLSEEEQRADMGQYTAHPQEEMLDYIYDHFDVFRLLLDGAHGTRFSCFLDELVDIEVEYTYKYMEVIGCESVKSGLVTEEFIHIIVTAYFNGMFEVVRHNGPCRRPPLCQDAQPLPHGGIFHRVRSSVLIRGCAFGCSPPICAKVSDH